ncbi:hypothetical protein ABT034_33145 [Streptomyces sp. NPDC002773]|uniref:hypothetical protein n=1 Tax=Streptomyces sp. NPDC002773 TaxID=3154430 RepID=UPI003328246C
MTHHFPDDLVCAQEAWTRTYEELARPRTPSGAGNTALRRRLIRLSATVWFHPYWARPRPGAGRAELLDHARSQGRDRERATA